VPLRLLDLPPLPAGQAITSYLGHASIQTTFDLYGHLMPGNEEETVALVNAYLERADTRHRLAQLGPGE
jgi:hypothetical protein